MVELREHQKKAVNELSNGKVLYGGVGSGKSLTAAAYYVQRESPKDVYVITTAKKRDSLDWQGEFAHFGIGRERDATLGGVLTVDSYNNIDKYTEVENAFFIFDEQRLVGSGAWSKAFVKIARRNNWILLSATPGDTWLDYIPIFVANGFYKNRTEFKREHVVYNTFSKFPKVDRYVGVGKLVKLRNQILVEMPYEQHTSRKQYDIRVTYDKECLHTATSKRWNVYEDRPIRDITELFSVMRKIVNSDPSRFLEVRKLIQKHPKVIIFYNFNYELDILRELAEEEPWRTSSMSSKDTSRTPTPGSASSSVKRSPESSTTSSSPELSDRTAFGKSPTSKFPSSSKGLGTKSSTKTRSSSISEMRTHGSLPKRSSSRGPSSVETDTTPSPESGTAPIQSLVSPRSRVTAPAASSGSSASPTFAVAEEEEWGSQKFQEGSLSTDFLSRTTASTASKTSVDDGENSRNETFAIAEWNGHKHEPIPDTDRWVYLVQYAAGSEGWNCIETDAMIFYSLTYSYKHWHQAFGRIDRMNSPFSELHYYVLRSDAPIDRAVWGALKNKKSFNESSLKGTYADTWDQQTTSNYTKRAY